MADLPKDSRSRNYIMMRMIMDIGMGLLYIAVAIFLMFADRLGFNLSFPPKPFSYVFGGICLLYGLFRIYRGVKKNYLR